ncbi:cell wall hydrolase [Butyrivibrio sp.]|uniref:cell wall hydrolase n=1 Tax=Butyrivibrio sp. TaxID=28121 RepID=UPI0025C562C7|nr:cell wall hydrolase [Butyrivibrio sp.]MBQ9305826.1 cell wall hydrolase [Butyrivibrio sp.]
MSITQAYTEYRKDSGCEDSAGKGRAIKVGIRRRVAGFVIGATAAGCASVTTFGADLPVAGEARVLSELHLPEAGVEKVFSGRLKLTIDKQKQERITVYRDDTDEYLLARLAMAEAEGEDIEGKALVIKVVMNRFASEMFPNSIREIIFQEKQFASISDGRWYKVQPNEECWKALELIKKGWDKSQGALFFERSDLSDSWQSQHLQLVKTHQHHNFYRR